MAGGRTLKNGHMPQSSGNSTARELSYTPRKP